jgi:hypothetical protein
MPFYIPVSCLTTIVGCNTWAQNPLDLASRQPRVRFRHHRVHDLLREIWWLLLVAHANSYYSSYKINRNSRTQDHCRRNLSDWRSKLG